MLTIINHFNDINFEQLMDVYIEGNTENAIEFYSHLSKIDGIKQAEQDFRNFLEKFFQNEQSCYAIWKINKEYICCLRLTPYLDGYLLEALETKPSKRKQGYACQLIQAVKEELSTPLYSHILKNNIPSLNIHEKCGFKRIQEFATYSNGTINPACYTYAYKPEFF